MRDTTIIKISFGLFLLLSLFPFRALSGESTTFRAGGDFTHYKNQSAIYSLGLEDFNSDGFGVKGEVGAWSDIGAGRRSSPFASGLIGKRFGTYQGFNATGLFGMNIIGFPDSALSSPFQFTEEVILGYSNVGIGYKHFSNAGLTMPNLGRDYISLTVAFPF